jgi:hypothetical protein
LGDSFSKLALKYGQIKEDFDVVAEQHNFPHKALSAFNKEFEKRALNAVVCLASYEDAEGHKQQAM